MRGGLAGYFHGEYGASRAYLLQKLFLLTLALDTWMLMIGHAGRYGVTDFNVAHFRWLDALMPTPSSAFYIAVLLLTGLLSIAMAFGAISRLLSALLCLSFTLSWSMSMLDSYQHHYFVSLVLGCMVFFPRLSATDLHPLPPPPPESEKAKKRRRHEQERVARAERAGWYYTLAVTGASATYLLVDPGEHTWWWFFALVAIYGVASVLYRPDGQGAPARTRGFGWPLLAATIGIVYLFTSVAKMDEQWIAGHTILRISAASRVFAPLAEYAGQLGIEGERFWSLFATSVIPQELLIAGAYLVSPLQDRLEARWPRVLCLGAFVLAMTLHVGAEAMGLEIGWFSYYMMMLAVAFLLPLPAVDRLATAVTWPGRWLSAQLADFGETPALAVAAGSGLMLCAAGYFADLPGATAAGVLAAAFLCAGALWLERSGAAQRAREYSVAAAAGATCLWLSLAASDVRWDYYRYLGGDLRRRGHAEAALEAYVRGERYAPPGQSRRDKIVELRKELDR